VRVGNSKSLLRDVDQVTAELFVVNWHHAVNVPFDLTVATIAVVCSLR
jgi:hypothetical protein